VQRYQPRTKSTRRFLQLKTRISVLVDITFAGEKTVLSSSKMHSSAPDLLILAMSMHDESLYAERVPACRRPRFNIPQTVSGVKLIDAMRRSCAVKLR
jgi:hypothetical protein